MNKRANIHLLEPSEAPYWRYTCADGAVAIYLPYGNRLTVERANILLDYAKRDLLDRE